ncbi:GTP cyclohydrolase 1 [Grosmannia clavigera kw1407]|uniref:GTP cyclohydrolase 1 n=1 Tax=Grosmannia clavigera (strain kw1407 / UAMH 11150) TaxID=655863 RepID=F0XAV7_GROCL|nr:GTP cyclohydrolase 1 [Grosmannia clavigera kw1407]EFX05132.1 GTP cyclohydrolase 1 [Grosmannia clavigera kw1407]
MGQSDANGGELLIQSLANGEKKGEKKDRGTGKERKRDRDARLSISKPARDLCDTPGSKKRRSESQPLQEEGEGKKTKTEENAQESNGSGSIARTADNPYIDFDGLSRPSRGTRERLEESDEARAIRLERMKGAVRTLLECVGEDPDREGLLATPLRYAKAMLEFTEGYQKNVRDIVNGAIFQEGHNEMVIVKDIDVYSICEHHLVPFTGKMHIGYIPNNAVIGISKLPRIAELFARRLQIQERLTREVANAVFEVLKPQGVAVVMESSHLCMVMRGVQKAGSTTITSCVLGCFEKREKTRNEFFSLIGVNRH